MSKPENNAEIYAPIDTAGLPHRPIHIAFLILPNFSLMALSSAIEPLRAANRLAGKTIYSWVLISPEGGTVYSSNAITVETEKAVSTPFTDRLFVVASLNITNERDAHLNHLLQSFARAGTAMGAISTGTFFLARAGLLHGHRCTLHWESLKMFSEEFPDIEVCREIFVYDRGRWTCAGGIAAIDLMLFQIATDHSAQLASNVADQFLHTRIRGAREHQQMKLQLRYGIHDERVVKAISVMEGQLEEPLDIKIIAKASNLSQRQLERLWHRFFNRTPQRFYLDLRLHEAQRLLRETGDSHETIALRCGFVSASHLSSSYKRNFGYNPSAERHTKR